MFWGLYWKGTTEKPRLVEAGSGEGMASAAPIQMPAQLADPRWSSTAKVKSMVAPVGMRRETSKGMAMMALGAALWPPVAAVLSQRAPGSEGSDWSQEGWALIWTSSPPSRPVRARAKSSALGGPEKFEKRVNVGVRE